MEPWDAISNQIFEETITLMALICCMIQLGWDLQELRYLIIADKGVKLRSQPNMWIPVVYSLGTAIARLVPVLSVRR